MKKFLILAIVFGLIFAFTDSFSKAPKTAKPAKGAKPTIGSVVSLTALAKGGDGKVKKDEALKLVEAGNPLVFLVGTGKTAKVYFVMNADGGFAAKQLAKYANVKKLGIEGATKTVNGVNIIVADKMTPMD